MQLATERANVAPAAEFNPSLTSASQNNPYSEYKVIHRNGAVVAFEQDFHCRDQTFIAVNGGRHRFGTGAGTGSRPHRDRGAGLLRRQPGSTFHIEDIRTRWNSRSCSGEHDVAGLRAVP